MLRNTFIHLPHIGRGTEERLWHNSVVTWQDIIDLKNEYATRFQHIKHLLTLSEHNLRSGNVHFFTQRLTSDQHWRVFPGFCNSIAYVDIETTGLGGANDYITTISLYDGNKVRVYVHGKNLEQFKDDIKQYKILVTYNGKCFDVPFIEREFGIQMDHAHLDLRYILRSLGLKGGLKGCERQLGLVRGDLEGIDGYFAVLLWKDYQNGNKSALDTLLAYNIEDTVNLEKLMLYAIEKKIGSIPISRNEIDSLNLIPNKPKQVKIHFKPDHQTINRIQKQFY